MIKMNSPIETLDIEAGEIYSKDSGWNNHFPDWIMILKYPSGTWTIGENSFQDRNKVLALNLEDGTNQEWDQSFLTYYSHVET